MSSSKKPWWWPQLANDEWRAQLREDMPEETEDMSDDELDEHYGTGWRYSDTWDHLGDARADYQELADAFLKLVEDSGKSPADFLGEEDLLIGGGE